MPIDLAAVLAETDRTIAALCNTQTHFELVLALRELAADS